MRDHKKRVAVVTSGGDSQGMNAAVRAVVRYAYINDMIPYVVYDGYQGLVDNHMEVLEWGHVQGLLAVGGTVIGTARCAAFRTRDGRRKAARNLVSEGIEALVVIGGDGSLTGADLFRSEWPSLLKELLQAGEINENQAARVKEFAIIGLVGSIDNDMCMTDLTIGAASALERICGAVDCIESTALSHGRAFIIEVMGRHCGWLALQAAIATGADWLFVPERPTMDDTPWDDVMVAHLKKLRDLGQRRLLIIMCEGAIDKNCNPITAAQVKTAMKEKLGLDPRITNLGHVQRGGTPCFMDRYIGTIQGIKAIEVLSRWDPSHQSPVIGMSNNQVTVAPLVEAVALTKQVSEAIDVKNFRRAMELRDPDFARSYDAYMAMTKQTEHLYSSSSARMYKKVHRDIPPQITKGTVSGGRMRVGIMHIGAPAGAMNMATRVAALLIMNRGHEPYAIHNGWDGLEQLEVRRLWRSDVWNWTALGGSELGLNRTKVTPKNVQDIIRALRHLQLDSMIIIGGFEAFLSAYQLKYQLSDKASKLYGGNCPCSDADLEYLRRMPVVVIPATISNNVPGTENSLGSDTALNVIVDACDKIKQSARASRDRVFVMETQGAKCGYLATLAGLAAGATNVYIPEEGITLKGLQNDVKHLRRVYHQKYSKQRKQSFLATGGLQQTGGGATAGNIMPRRSESGPPTSPGKLRADSFHLHDDLPSGTNHFKPRISEGRVILRTDRASELYTTEMIANMLKEEGQGLFDSRSLVLGHLQQGGSPSPLDRITATKFAVAAVDHVEFEQQRVFNSHGPMDGPDPSGFSKACMVAVQGSSMSVRDIQPIMEHETDVPNRVAKKPWWIGFRELIPLMARYTYFGDN